MRRLISTAVVGVILVVCVWSGGARAEVLRVDPNDPGAFATLQEAVAAAASGDTIVVAAGVYRGAGNRDVSFTDKIISLRSESGPEQCTIDCEGQGSAFILDSGRPGLVLDGFSITGGQGGEGGAIRAPSVGALTLLNCILADNDATGSGGAVHVGVGEAAFCNCIFRDNTSTSTGGAVYADVAELLLEDCIFVGNQAVLSGGGLYSFGYGPYRTVRRCGFYGNRAGSRGGAAYYTGPARMSNSVFSGNSAHDDGGAVRAGSWAIVMHCTFAGNRSDAWGGAWASDEDKVPVDMYSSIFWGNQDQAGQGASAQIYGARLEAVYSCIQNWPALATVNSEDPQFADANGPDEVPGTADDDLSLRPGSPCIDTGFLSSAPWPFDLDRSRRPRLAGTTIDLGAYEFHADTLPPEPVGAWQPEPVIVSEVLAHSPGTRDWVELHNTSDKVIDITGWQIEDQQQNVFTFGPNSRIEPQGYLVVYQRSHLPFGFEARGDWIVFYATIQGIGTGYWQVHRLRGVLTDTTLVRHVNSVGLVELVPSVEPTPGRANASIAMSPVVITEIMYAPPDGNMPGQYVEIANVGDAPVVLPDPVARLSLRLNGDVFHQIPWQNQVVLPPGGRLLFAQDPDALLQAYPNIPSEAAIVGPWQGSLSPEGGEVFLYTPNVPDERLVLADSVTYNVGHAVLDDDWALYWSPTANGEGDSLHRLSLTSYGNDPNNWQAGPPTPGY
ncbi:MAG: lamin tail domain-containing protein [Sedimentisphaerales bacterium]|nr:lamin tail domain-containing protein [Sedimentisphaerales bacterium]